MEEKVSKVIVISGGFDPPHEGHTRYIIEAEKLGDKLIVILNSDEFLDKKKAELGGRFYRDIDERREILQWGLGIRFGRKSEIIDCIDNDMTVARTLELIRQKYPNDEIIFAKGGDRKDETSLPDEEVMVCGRYDIEMRFGVGGFSKPQSSSWLLERYKTGKTAKQ